MLEIFWTPVHYFIREWWKKTSPMICLKGFCFSIFHAHSTENSEINWVDRIGKLWVNFSVQRSKELELVPVCLSVCQSPARFNTWDLQTTETFQHILIQFFEHMGIGLWIVLSPCHCAGGNTFSCVGVYLSLLQRA